MEYGKIEASEKTQLTDTEARDTGVPDNLLKIKRNKLVCKLLCIIVVLYLFIFYIFMDLVYYTEDNNSEYKKDEIKQIDSDISAKFPMHHNHHQLKCSDYKFGCCEIYYGCDKGKHKTLSISPYMIVKHDEEGTNCPSLNTLVNQYNQAYVADNSELGKCSINTVCDSSVRGIQGSVMRLVSLDIDEYHCNSVPMLINLYESRWPTQYTPAEEFLIMLGIMFSIIACLAG
jgi:hypothetical protein